MNFMFLWQEQYLTRSLRSLVRYCSCHSNIKFISYRHCVIFSISAALCRSFKAMSLIEIYPYRASMKGNSKCTSSYCVGSIGDTEQGSQHCFTDVTKVELLLWCRLQVQVTSTQKWYFIIHNNQCQESYFPHVHFVYLCRAIPFTIQPIPPPTPMDEIFQGRIWKLFLREQLSKWGVWEKHSLSLKRNI